MKVLVGGTVQDPQLVPADKPLTIQHLFTPTSGLNVRNSRRANL